MILVMNDNKISVFGDDDHGKLGLGFVEGFQVTTEIPELSDKKIEAFFEGYDCMFARSETNEIYSWGMNYWGQLGRGYESGMFDYLKPERVKFFDDKNIIEIIIGFDHCLAVSCDGKVYGWGYNNNGQIDPNSNETQILMPLIIIDKIVLSSHSFMQIFH